jgi:uracil-DNA glycosylase
VPGSLLELIDESWQATLLPHSLALENIAKHIAGQRFTPPREKIFSVFEKPIAHYRVVIVGQDPYPTPGFANGLAFSVAATSTKLPASLRNIFSEYMTDTGFSAPTTGDLTSWSKNGVALLNSTLTLNLANKSEHLKIGWQQITEAALVTLAENNCVAILWGNHAQKIGSVFPENLQIRSVHPSPLSAYRGFFGSKPFSKANDLLIGNNQRPIQWLLP